MEAPGPGRRQPAVPWLGRPGAPLGGGRGGPGGTRPIPSRTHEQEDLGGPRRTLEDLGGLWTRPTLVLWKIHTQEDPETERPGNWATNILGLKKEPRGTKRIGESRCIFNSLTRKTKRGQEHQYRTDPKHIFSCCFLNPPYPDISRLSTHILQ